VSGLVNLCWAVDGVLDTFPDEGEAAFERGFSLLLSNRGMNGIVDCVKKLRNLVDAKQCISVENEPENDLTRGESPTFEGCSYNL
jgi:hypothetical protein